MLYELTFLIKEESELKNIKDLIVSNSGQIKKEESWGEKTLSFPIKKNRTAKFYNYFIEMEKKNVTEIRKKLNFSENLLRFLLLISES
ncbi:MAG: 30S ribosomal protein S6 [Candidatus Roizmanbacteria bacterium GW2011_GWA2_35_19]|uniref:Small ribosomal subunit protein bS6 n=2 Tax=Candidatus Roizmaniibacteriota TaxID=1752723 RepID=A0A0G0E8J6_9BACT|nr:MAG: 30S ribosomal protein S6 [Candidatus Roizmanbacteria bacterium GW2011_GWC2_35_12]KKP71635.1 MAG: 30S ribosomal protein S6 [Candidatus Roizmanbacteria bacterium GW2011_GWA2_35_19]